MKIIPIIAMSPDAAQNFNGELFWVYVTKLIYCGTLRNRKDRWITVCNVPTWRWLVVYNGTFCLKPNAYTSQVSLSVANHSL